MSTFKNDGFNEVNESNDSKNRDTMIGIAVVIMVFTSTYHLIINLITTITGNYEIYMKVAAISFFISLIDCSVPVILALSVKNTMWKTILIGLSVVYFFMRMFFSFQGILSELLRGL